MPGIPEGRTAKLADKTTGVVLKEGRYDAGAKISGVYENGNEVTYKITYNVSKKNGKVLVSKEKIKEEVKF